MTKTVSVPLCTAGTPRAGGGTVFATGHTMAWHREIVVVDDDPLMLRAMELTLEDRARVHAFANATEAEAFLARHRVDVAILDLNMPGRDGLTVMQDWKKRFSELHVIICSGESRVSRAIECMRAGATDYVVKPFRREDLTLVVERVWERVELQRAAEHLRSIKREPIEAFVGDSAAVRQVLERVQMLEGQHHVNVLILGESGTGKELVARQIHRQENDAERPLVVANMPAIPASLAESELFGVEKGAFTDAKQTRLGKFELADRGDIFLDEIGDLPMELQAKILRALQEREIERVGSNRVRKVRFRCISATNRTLAALIAEDKFRLDLYYRLSDVVLDLPALRERPEDIPLLVAHFARKYGGGSDVKIAPSALRQLGKYHWPGNVRQLESTIKRALVFARGQTIESFDLFEGAAPGPATPERTFREELAEVENSRIEAAMQRHGGDPRAAYRELGMSRSTFYRRLKRNRELPRRKPHGSK